MQSLHPRTQLPELASVMQSKKILRLWLRWAAPQRRLLRLSTNKEGYRGCLSENSSKSLLTGEFCRWNLERVPRGSLAVYVGPELRRFVIPASYLSMPDFRALMDKAADEFGFQQEGGLRIPCDEDDFEEILVKCLSMHRTMNKKKDKHDRNTRLMDKSSSH